ncbi:hypothetical protein RB597_010491 [Gaeumannomyces tritici]
MSAIQQLNQIELLMRECEAEKRVQDARLQQEQEKLEKRLEEIKQQRKAVGEEVAQSYMKRIFSDLAGTQALEPPASPNKGRSTSNRLPSDGSGHDDGPEDSDNDESEDNKEPEDDGSEDSDSDESEDNTKPVHNTKLVRNTEPVHNRDEPTSAASVSPRARRKRELPTEGKGDLEHPSKRRRRGGEVGRTRVSRVGEATSDGVEKTVSFEEVRDQHRIIAWPAASPHFYTLRCENHGKFFDSKDPVQGAGKHLSKIHGTSGTHQNAIRELGFRVQNCTREQVGESNRAIDQLNAVDKPNAIDQPHRRIVKDPKASIQPTHGKFYQVSWSAGAKTRPGTPYVALCLPTGDFDIVGISGSISTTGLGICIPRCYRTRAENILEWNEGYQDGGKKAYYRKFPFLFFTSDVKVPSEGKLSIPEKGKVLAWVSASDIQQLDLNDETALRLSGYAAALAFQKLRCQNEQAVAINNQSSTEPDSRNAGDDSGSGDHSRDGIREVPATSLRASGSESSGHDPHAEQLAAEAPRSNAGDDNGSRDHSRDGSQEVPATSLRASGSESSRHSPHAEQLVAETPRSELRPADWVDSSANSALAALNIIGQGPDSQLDQSARTQEAPTPRKGCDVAEGRGRLDFILGRN